MIKNVLFGIGFAVVSILGVQMYASPYSAMKDLKKGFETKNATLISEYVDYPRLQTSVKGEFTKAMNQSIESKVKDPADMAAMAIATKFASSMFDAIVDKMVSEQGLKLALENQKSSKFDRSKLDIEYGYQSFSRFNLYIKNKETADYMILKFEREGLTTWKAVDIQLSDSIYEKVKNQRLGRSI